MEALDMQDDDDQQDSPYAHNHHPQTHTTATNRNDTTPTTPTSRNRNRRSRRAPNLPLNEHYNEPVRHHVWYSKRRTWTRAQLDRERTEFFETRVTGRSEVWAAVASAILLMRAGDLATAQSIVDAAGITVPTGDLCEGCYDQQGVLYRLPQCIVSDPENIVVTPDTDATVSERDLGDAGDGDEDDEDELDDNGIHDRKLATDDASGDELIEREIERRRDEKGKTSERDLIRVLARLSDRGGPDLVLSVGKGQTVGFLARRVHQEAELADNARVRIAYLGHLLKEQQSLLDQGWKVGDVVNALVVSLSNGSGIRR
ncbi:hypothetical protein N7508_006571 [Penicillium antarcticum]|uniref:uncharacterized protein n=1 Tax=Penicillium antarcticum TaxID=416450 RepID=UPI00239F3E9C|nr:uncharacterized protein N7508_006571 [Penicillium antarcticum]KAJ5301708.1 hypothetical protein N7508_006571 [Penicillium antarcticum]